MDTDILVDSTHATRAVVRFRNTEQLFDEDYLADEEPLEIVLGWYEGSAIHRKTLAVTMRTPGHDRELAAGWLLAEQIIHSAEEIEAIWHYEPDAEHSLHVQLRVGVRVAWERLERHTLTTASCGICGKTVVDTLQHDICSRNGFLPVNDTPRISLSALYALPAQLRKAQEQFQQTGGVHAAALLSTEPLNTEGALQIVREDVGRHNAVDKVLGHELLAGRCPLASSLLLLSGRVSYELVHKAVLAGVPIIAALGAPSVLAVETAERFGITLIGFLRHNGCNVYYGAERIITDVSN